MSGSDRMAASNDVYSVGLSTVDITPPVGIYLAGFAARTEPSTGVYHPLRATAVAIDDGQSAILLVAADLLGFYEHAPWVREGIAAATGLSSQAIMLCGSHTHCGPAIREIDRERHGQLDWDYIRQLVERLARCAGDAWERRAPSRLHYGVGRCTFAVSRRKPDGAGRVLWQPSPESPHDHDVPVLSVESLEGRLQGVVFSYACHPTSRGGLLIGADYVGYAYDYVESRYRGAVACFVQGCGADQKPVPVDPDSTEFGQREVEEVRLLGDQLGRSVVDVLQEDELAPVTGPISVNQRVLELTTQPIDPRVVESSLDAGPQYVRDWAQMMRDRLERQEQLQGSVPFEIQTVRFDRSLAVVALAGEITAEHGLRLKRELGPFFSQNAGGPVGLFVIGYANHIVGYVPVRRQIPEGGYEVWTAQQIHKRTGPFVPETEDQIHAAVRQALDVL